MLKKLIAMAAVVAVIFTGCSKDEAAVQKVSSTFTVDHLTLTGTKDKFGMTRINRMANEPEFPVDKAGHYQVFFYDKDFNGKRYKITATHKETGEIVDLYEWDIENNQSGAKFVIEKAGIWKIDVFVDGEKYTSFMIKAKSIPKENEAANPKKPYPSEQAIKNGDIVNRHGEISNLEKFKNFIENIDNGVKDKIRITMYTIEGDPIFYQLTFDGSKIQYTFDNSQDTFGGTGKGITSTSCTTIEKRNTDKEVGYYLSGCSSEVGDTFYFRVQNKEK